MSATIIPLNGEPWQTSDSPQEDTDRGHHAVFDALASLREAMGWITSDNEIHARSEEERLVIRLSVAYWKFRGRAMSRIAQLERSVRMMISSEHLTEEQRTALLEVVYGTASMRHVKQLSAAEQRMVEHYRAMDNSGRMMLRKLVERVARTTTDDEQGGA